jgi:hypothetical protein
LVDDIAAAERSAEICSRRAVAVLTWIGTPEARRLLEEWAKSDRESGLREPAAAALKLWQ